MEKITWEEIESRRGTFIKGEWPTITEQFHIAVHDYPEETAFSQFSPKEVHITYAQAFDNVRRVAGWLVSKGFKKGDRAVLTGKNSPWWAIAYLGVLEAGGVIVPLDVQMEEKTAEHLIKLTDAVFLFADKDKFEKIGKRGSGIKYRISLTPSDPEDSGTAAKVGRIPFIGSLPEIKKDLQFDQAEENDLAAILFTSGTTGLEKGVMLTHANFMSDVYLAALPDYLPVEHKEVWYALLPLHHSYCMTAVFLEGIMHGSEIVFAGGLSVAQMMEDLQKGGITVFIGIPLLYNKILKGIMNQVRGKSLLAYWFVGLLLRISGLFKIVFRVNIGKKLFGNLLLKKANLYNLKYLISGGGPLAPETVRRYQELGLDFVQGYGMTETSPISTLNPAHAFKLKSVGKVFPMLEFKILDPDKNGIGEVAIKGPICTQGYWKNPEATKELFNEDGWLLTGDLGYLDKDNYLYLTGRSKNMIVTEGGKNVFPEEIEDHFQLFHQIEQIMVRGYVADKDTRAEALEAVIVPSSEYFGSVGTWEDERINKDILQIVKSVNRELLPYKRISRVRIYNGELPMTSTRKIKRQEVNKLIPLSEENVLNI